MLSVVIPVFNEEARLRETLAAVGRHMSQIAARIAASSIKSIPATGAFEIVVSDDGSRDRSVAIAEEVARELPIRLLRGEKNQGKGAAVRRGMVAAAGDPVFFFDADLSTPLSEISPFLDALDAGADVVIGTRKHRQAQIVRPQPWHRVQLGLAYTRLTNRLLGLSFSDFTCGFKAFRAAAAREIFTR